MHIRGLDRWQVGPGVRERRTDGGRVTTSQHQHLPRAWARAAATLRPRGRAVPALTTLGIGLAVLVPLFFWGAIVRETVAADIGRREADQRVLTAQLASTSVDEALQEAGGRLELFGSRVLLREALQRADTTELERHLADLRRGTTFGSAVALDPDGRMLAQHPASAELYGQSFADLDYYRGAITGEGTYISEVFASRTAGNPPSVAVARAVRNGGLIGVVQLTIAPTQLLDILRPLLDTQGRHVEIVDLHGRVVVSTDPLRPPLSDSRLSGLSSAALGQKGTTTTNLDGLERVVTYASAPSARWTVIISDDPAVVLASVRQLEQQLLLGGAFAALLAFVVAFGISWLYATSLRQRRAIAEREAALQLANAELMAASRHKSEFLAGMSHELRTPLNAILGFSELLEEQLGAALGDRQRRYLRNVRDAGQHLLGLINDVLDLSKVEAGRVDLRPEPTTLDALTGPVISSTRASAEVRGLRFRVEVDRKLEVAADVGRVRQILYNLLSNAVKFTAPEGEVLFRAGRSGRDLRIEVKDTGIGIPSDRREHVFGTFERLHEGRSDAPGTGLGLALTKSLVELHGGTITFESRENEGTTFRVTLPGLVVDSAPGDRVLIVEDERRDAELVMALAGSVGLRAEIVPSVVEALAAIRRATPIAVVLDLRLSGERGERVLEALRADPATSGVPVVVVTVEDDDGNSHSLGADDHLTKPIDRAQLTAWLGRVAARAARKGA
jgi:signal transduction histidine kinase/ActR/RegA family two-component response regulator